MASARSYAEELKPWVRAQVIDLRRADTLTEAKYLVDTNVLYFIHYDRFGSLEELGKGPRPYQLKHYPQYLKRVREKGGGLFVHRLGLIEFARAVERAELYILHAIKTPGITEIPPEISIKDLRKTYPENYGNCQERVLTYMGAVRKAYPLIQMATQEEPAFWKQWNTKWQTSIADPEDAAQLVDALASGISSIISDDSDWVSIEGIRFFTANPVAIQAARLAGKLTR